MEDLSPVLFLNNLYFLIIKKIGECTKDLFDDFL